MVNLCLVFPSSYLIPVLPGIVFSLGHFNHNISEVTFEVLLLKFFLLLYIFHDLIILLILISNAGKIPLGFLTFWNTVYCVGQESIH